LLSTAAPTLLLSLGFLGLLSLLRLLRTPLAHKHLEELGKVITHRLRPHALRVGSLSRLLGLLTLHKRG
jgi:hypothetical protein